MMIGAKDMDTSAYRADFAEIEQKFALNELFDPDLFRRSVLSLNPHKSNAIEVRDVYYLLANNGRYIFRHRYDEELQHLTAKSIIPDAEIRTEINIDLGQHKGDQKKTVDAFFETIGVTWQGTIHKRIEVYYFHDCEIVFYEAWRAGRQRLRFVEFEAKDTSDLDAARAVIERYKSLTGFESHPREKRALVEILFPELRLHQ